MQNLSEIPLIVFVNFHNSPDLEAADYKPSVHSNSPIIRKTG
jgi:hypothetical protein